MIPLEIVRQLPVPPLNDPKELPTIEAQERIRREMDFQLPRWSGPEEALPPDPTGPSKSTGAGGGGGGESEDAAARGLGGVPGAGWWGDEKGGKWMPYRLEVEPGDWRDRAIEIVDILQKYRDPRCVDVCARG